jgi:hypothetical protein
MFRQMMLAVMFLATLGIAELAVPNHASAWDGWYAPYYDYWLPRRGYDYRGAPFYPGYGPPYYPGYGPPYTAGISPHYPYPRYIYYPPYRTAYPAYPFTYGSGWNGYGDTYYR